MKFNHNFSIISTILLGAIAINNEYEKVTGHSLEALSKTDEALNIWLPLGICVVIAGIAVKRYLRTKDKKLLFSILLTPLFFVAVSIISQIEEQESSNKIVCRLLQQDALSSLEIQLKTGSIYTIRSYNLMSNVWVEGKYQIKNDTLTLNGPTDIINNQLVFICDSFKCRKLAKYSFKEPDAGNQQNELKVVFDSLNSVTVN